MRYIVTMILFVFICSSAIAQRPSLSTIRNWGYQLQDIHASEIASNSSFQLIVMDYSSDGTEATRFSEAEIRAIRESGKEAIAYFSIGEAENYRFYWKQEWNSTPPAWLGPENPDWPGNYKVRFWDADWQQIVFSYLDKVIEQGFDGIYLDIIDGFSYWMHENPEQPMADTLMVNFVRAIREYADTHAPGAFYIIPQNPDDLLHSDNITPAMRANFFDAIDAVGVEDVFFPGSEPENNPFSPDTERIAHLQEFRTAGNPVFSIEYLTQMQKTNQYVTAARDAGFVPYVCTRELNTLCDGVTTAIAGTPAPLPERIQMQITPQPLSNSGIIRIASVDRHLISISLFDSAGRHLRSLYSGQLATGVHLIPFDVSDFPSGTYVVSMLQGANTITVPLRVLR